jgi:hypothetical protein
MTHDYIRNGTTTLFAVLNVLDGTITGQCMARSPSGIHPFPKPDRSGGPGRQTGPRDPRQLRRPQASQGPRLARPHPRWTFYFTPTSCSWANAVESFFGTLTRRRLQRGVFHSLVDLQAAINRYLGEHNRKPKAFVWTADPDRIIEKVNRGHQAIASHH